MRPLSRQVTIALLLAGALAVASVLNSRLPNAQDVMDEPFVIHGGVGESLRLRTGTLTVNRVDATNVVTLDGRAAQTTAVWLVLEATFDATGEARALAIDAGSIETVDGRAFGHTSPLRPTCGMAQPGLPITCTFAYEIAADALAGAHLKMPAASLVVGPDEDSFADVELGITDAVAADLGARHTPLPLGVRAGRGI